MDDALRTRLRRIYAAIDAVEEDDLSTFRSTVAVSPRQVVVSQDWSGGKSSEEVENLAHGAIHNIATLCDHLRRWARQHGVDPDEVDRAANASPSIQVVRDLADVDKHGGNRRDGGYSRRSPRLDRIFPVMGLSVGSEAGSFVSVTLTPHPVARGSGSATVIVTGEVVDGQGAPLGDLYDLMKDAVRCWEAFLDAHAPGWK
jgi:hypothetical protein